MTNINNSAPPPPGKKGYSTKALLVGLGSCCALFAAVIVLGMLAPGNTSNSTAAPSTAPAASTPAPTDSPAPANRIGTPVNEDGVIYTVTTVQNNAVIPYSSMDAGHRAVYVELTAQNTQAKDVSVSSIMCFTLKDAAGDKGEFLLSTGGAPNLDGTLTPGESLKGSLAFKVPINAAGLYLKVNCGITGGSTISLQQ